MHVDASVVREIQNFGRKDETICGDHQRVRFPSSQNVQRLAIGEPRRRQHGKLGTVGHPFDG